MDCDRLPERLDVGSPLAASVDPSVVAESIGSTPASDYSAPNPSDNHPRPFHFPPGPYSPPSDRHEPPSPVSPRRPSPTTGPSCSSPRSPPVTPLSVSPCDSPSERMLLLGSPSPLTTTPVLPPPRVCRPPSPPASVAMASPPPKKPSRGRSLVRRPCRVRGAVRSRDRSKLKKLNFSPRRPSRGRNQRHNILCGAVPGFGEQEVTWSNGEDDSPVAPLSPVNSPFVHLQYVHLQSVPALPLTSKPLTSKPSGPPPSATCGPPSTPRALKSRGSSPVHPSSQRQPRRLFPPDLPTNNLQRRIRRFQPSSLAPSSPLMGSGVIDVADSGKKAYLEDKRIVLTELKRVCFVDSDSGDCPLPSDCVPQDRRCVSFRDDSCDLSSSTSTKLQAEENRQFALEVLRETFPAACVPPLPHPPPPVSSASVVNHSNAGSVLVASDEERADFEVAPPIPLVKRRHLTAAGWSRNSSLDASAAVSAALHKLRPRPSSVSDDGDSQCDPSPCASVHPSDEDCAVDVTFDHPSCPPKPTSSVANVCAESASLAPPGRAKSLGAAAVPPAPSDSPPPSENAGPEDDHDTTHDLLMPPAELARLQEFRALWTERFTCDTSWDEFSNLCEHFAAESRDLARSLSQPMAPKPNPAKPNPPPPPPPPPRRPPHGRGFRRFNPVEARRIQGLYRHSKKRAARRLLCDASIQYSGSIADAESYFEGVLSDKPCNASLLAEALKADVPNAVDHETTRDLKNAVTEAEVAAKLRSAANTAPGADRVEYAHLKRVDPSGKILTLIFNTCLRAQDVPAVWKEAVTVLIYKKGDSAEISNFRPIALMSCVYKLLMGIMAKRITRWAIDSGILSLEQKCARPTEGCYEHTYILKSLVGQARRDKKKVCVAWLDIRNAFGSVPHSTILHTLRHLGAPEELVSFVMNAYTGAATTIRTPDGTTRAIPIRAGVKQGCPLSPILFNLCIELILRRVKSAATKLKTGQCVHYGSLLSCLAYADDLVIVARNKAALQTLLDAASEAARVVGFTFRPDKCASLSLTSTKQRATFVEPQDFLIQGQHIPALENEEPYRYLGVPIGLIHNIDDLPNIVPTLIKQVDLIAASLLAPWQKIDALRTFVQPCLTYALRAGNPLMKSLDCYRSTLVRALRDICNLPDRATAKYFFSHKKTGGLAFQEPRTECDVQAIVQAVRILSSQDPAVSTMARHELRYIVRRSTQSEPTPELISIYLSSLPDRRTEHLNYTYSSLWSRVREACRRQRVTFHYSDANEVTISADESEHVKSKVVATFLHRLVQSRCGDALMALKDQGKVARCLSQDLYANGSTWHCTGLNLRFKDWRFIHRARLNVVPLNANKSRYSNTDPACRHCGQHAETLPHVICHCHRHMVHVRGRHDAVVDRLTNSIRFGKITTDRTVADSNLRLRPDIVVEEDDRVIIIDVTCPFDNDSDALSEAALAKVHKYQPLKEYVQSKGKSCEVFPFVVGALGSWYKQNEILLTKLGMTRRYKSLFRKLCCTDAIQGSNDIYRLHLGCDDRIPGVSG